MAYTLDDYNSGYTLNASNVIEEDLKENVKVEPYIGGWLTVRADSDLVGQITESNASYKLRQDIYKIYKMLIRGVSVKITNGSNTTLVSGNTSDGY
jgi:hypothetical protein